MASEQCKKFTYCNAPLCPLDPESLKHGLWYPDENICSIGEEDWIEKQKEIVKMNADPEFFFDLKMLKEIKEVRSDVKGADPNK